MYNGLNKGGKDIDQAKIVPFLKDPAKIRDYMNIPNCYFKIVTDLECAEVALGFKIYQAVIEFYIYYE